MKFHHTLTDARLRGIKPTPDGKPFKIADGEGLHLLVTPSGGMYWRYNYRAAGKAKTMALGTYPDITLKIARERHYAASAIVKSGADPSADKKVAKEQAKAEVIAAQTFREIATKWHAVMAPAEKRAPKSGDRDERMVRYLNAEFGDKPARDLEVLDLATLLDKYERAGKYETRVRVQGTAVAIMGFGVGRGYFKHNPFLGVKFSSAFTAPADKPRPALTEPVGFGYLLSKIEHYEGRDGNLTGMALELLTLTFVRPGDVAKAEWAHFNLDEAKWAIPFEQLKQRTQREESDDSRVGLPHEVPLSRQAVALLRNLKRRTGNSRWLFPGRQKARTMSENTMLAALNALGYKGVHCPHGFRSSASTILNAERIMVGDRKVRRFEQGLIELQLDHNDESTRAIYDRGDCWEERVELMQFWADKVDRLRTGKPTGHKPELVAV
jgi:integrase